MPSCMNKGIFSWDALLSERNLAPGVWSEVPRERHLMDAISIIHIKRAPNFLEALLAKIYRLDLEVTAKGDY